MIKIVFAILVVANIALSHVPVITPSDHPNGDLPPKLEERPLPPVVFVDAMTQIPIVINNGEILRLYIQNR